jgi:guanylate kinase
MDQKKMIIFSAPSGSGKSTIINYLLQKGYPIEFSISATTRPPRGNEQYGVEYYFFSLEEFKKRIDAGEFLEYEEVYENRFYGTLNAECERIWAKGKTIVFDVDVAGGIRLKELFGDRALAIFIQIPSFEELCRRLEVRNTETAEELEKRISKAHFESQFSYMFDIIVLNDELEDACKKTEEIISQFLNEL